MTKKILVTYASKYGATAEIAERISEIVADAGHAVELSPVKEVQNLKGYDGVILGSAVYYGRWHKDAVRFLKNSVGELSDLPTWFFSSGPVGEGNAVELLDGWTFPPLQQEIADRIQPMDTAVFHGVLDGSKLNRMEKFVLEKMESPVGDFRDWDLITAWADKIARSLD